MLRHPFRLALLLLLAAPAHGWPKGTMTVTQVTFTIEHQPDGKQHPNQVKETYVLGDGGLHYTAYFGGMPTDMNHMDSQDWQPGELGKKVFATVLALASDPTSGLSPLPDSGPSPDPGPSGVYVATLRQDGADRGRFVKDTRSKAWSKLDASFAALIAAFEKQTGRPLTVGQLPQTPRRPPPPTPQESAIAKALPVVNAALIKSYQKFAKRKDAVAPAHPDPWVTADGAVVTGDASHGFTLTWALHPPAGFELDAVVKVSPRGKLQVTRADASFSPD